MRAGRTATLRLMAARSIVLVGPMGVGKSSVGRALAAHLHMGHVDTDDTVEHLSGTSIPRIFERDGEPAFRALETEALAASLGGPPAVISTGGGIVMAADNRLLLRDSNAFVVWLDGTIDALAGRLGTGRGRPLLEGGDVRTLLKEKVEERAPGYLEVADVRVDTSEMRHADCVDAIVAALGADAGGTT